MNKQEAKKKMSEGYKVRHKSFTKTEWIRSQGDDVFTEDGASLDYHSFWVYRSAPYFNEGWSVVEEGNKSLQFIEEKYGSASNLENKYLEAIQVLRSLVSEYEFIKPLLLNGGHRMNDAQGFMLNMDRANTLIKKNQE